MDHLRLKTAQAKRLITAFITAKMAKPKVFFDAMYASSPEEAKALVLGFAKELREKIEIIGVKAEA